MAPIDFEKELRKRLRSRELSPSEQAWDKISARIREDGPERKRRPGFWMGLAAACAALLLGYLWLWDSPEVPLRDPVVGTPEQQVANPPADTHPEATIVVDTEKQPDTQVAGTAYETEREMTPTEIARAGAAKEEPVQWVQASETIEQPIDMDEFTAERSEQPEGEIAAVASLDQEGQGISDEELDLLLLQARQEITANSEQDTLSGVDPMLLLDRAEDELDLTFREQILEKLKTGINKVRTSVADRNN